MKSKYIFTILSSLLLLSCAEANSIRRTFDTSGNSSQLIDAKQRSILISTQFRKNDNKMISQPIVCAEPSPDALSAIAASAGGSIFTPSGFTAELAGAVSESASSIGLRTQTIQLLRDSFYRLCEGYLSGAIDQDEYLVLQRRYQANMIAILAIEQLTGAIRPPSIVLSSNANAELAEGLDRLLARREQQAKRLTEKQKELEAEQAKSKDSDSATNTDSKIVNELNGNIKAIEASITKIDERISNPSANKFSSNASGSLEDINTSDRVKSDVAFAINNIVKLVISGNYMPQNCFNFLKSYESNYMLSTNTIPTSQSQHSALGQFCFNAIQRANIMNEIGDITTNTKAERS
jgi:hypothetical protein